MSPYYQNYFQPQMQQAPSQIQNSGFIPVPNEEAARNYPVAPGNSITFKNENAPYVYTKTMGFSQLDRPIFERYKLVREDEPVTETPVVQNNDLTEQIDALWGEVNALKKQMSRRSQRKRSEDRSGGHDEQHE